MRAQIIQTVDFQPPFAPDGMAVLRQHINRTQPLLQFRKLRVRPLMFGTNPPIPGRSNESRSTAILTSSEMRERFAFD